MSLPIRWKQLIVTLPVLGMFGIAFSRFLWLFNLEENIKVQHIPDDTFYYLNLAKNFASSGIWTFDGGESVSTGFHLFYAYLLAICSFFASSPTTFLNISIGINFLITVVFLSIVLLDSLKDYRIGLSIAVVFSTLNFSKNISSLMEWNLVILLHYLAIRTLFLLPSKGSLRKDQSFFIFVLGLAGSLGRSDYGLLSGVTFCLFAFYYTLTNKDKVLLEKSFYLLSGACVGLVVMFLHNYAFSGSFLQYSAKVKHWWSEVNHHNWRIAYYGVLRRAVPFDHLGGLWALPLLSSLSIFCGFVSGKFGGHIQRSLGAMLIAVLSSVITLAMYVAVYSQNSGSIQPWYTANMFMPVVVLIFTFLQGFEFFRWKVIGHSLCYAIPLIAAFLLADTTFKHWKNPEFSHQEQLYLAAKEIKKDPSLGRVGAWNSGLLGYYSENRVINIDGLVNNDIYDHLIDNDLICYLRQKPINYLVDFNRAVSASPRKGTAGLKGFNGRIYRPIRTIGPKYPQGTVTVYRMEEEQKKYFDQQCNI